ncbi:MAG TPA: LON peptidase substrate-binding domain-containing protein [Marmoricola sp.]|jgi:Lon protease-like protein|nr:LON peptidase substrate-binding domain-containing protein [Marmoricola sp.]
MSDAAGPEPGPAEDARRTVPLFPLNAVLFPGVTTPLHIFEDRYRAMVRDLLAITDPAERVFGIVAIREGYEVGEHSVQSSHRVGTLAQLVGHQAHDDGRFDLEVVGRQRFRVQEIHAGEEYLRAQVELYDEEDAGSAPAEGQVEAQVEAQRTRAMFEEYRSLLSDLRGGPVLAGELPRDPAYLSYALAATCLLTQGQRQELLEMPGPVQRLRRLRDLLHRERQAMQALPSLPATEVARTRWSPN